MGVYATSLYAVIILHSGITVTLQFFSLCSLCCRVIKNHWCPTSLFKNFLFYSKISELSEIFFIFFTRFWSLKSNTVISFNPKRIEICITPIRCLSRKGSFYTLAWKRCHGPNEQFGTLLRPGTWSSCTLIQKYNHGPLEQFGPLYLW